MTGGPERRDESVTFSLRELKELEDERVEQERLAKEARELAALRAREEAVRREREELAVRERAEAEERERVRRREVEEEARREAMSRAAVEQARIAVEARARAEEAERERRHELDMQRARVETQKKPGAGTIAGSGLMGAAVAVALCFGVHFAVAKPAADKRIAELDRAVAMAEGRADELSRRVAEQSGQIKDLKTELEEAKRAKTAQPVSSSSTGAQLPHRGGGGHVPVPATSNNKKDNPLNGGPPCANKFDPLCGHIGN
jgi:membrane protein involved in colicin uptake